jgi:hypothetical protein
VDGHRTIHAQLHAYTDGINGETVWAYYHGPGADPVNPATGQHGAPAPDYTKFESFRLVRPRSDGRR